MATVFIDNKAYEVPEGKNLLEACLSLGFDLPYFCWHPALGSVGACRQCAVKSFRDEEDTRGKLVMSCMEPVRDQARISIQDEDARNFRARIIEWLMVNHPHDCAVCDEGGSCHLQDMTVMTGHNYRRFRFNKRTYRNQYLGPFLNHEMNRCIHCYRCVRFYKDYAGGKDLDAMGAHHHVYFGRSEDGVLENEFSGNLAEVCPTGVFTDKTLKRHYTRKWDLTNAPSICQGCGTGCNIIASERYGELRQISNRYHGELNGYFICDRGRYGYEFVNSPLRIREARLEPDAMTLPAGLASSESGLERSGGPPAEADRAGEMVAAPGKRSGAERPGGGSAGGGAAAVAAALGKRLSGARLLGIASPRASLEANFALRCLVGEDNFCHGLSGTDFDLMDLTLRILRNGPARGPSLREVEDADAILVLGEDLVNTAPRIFLSLRQAVKGLPSEEASAKIKVPLWQDATIREAIQDRKAPLFSITPYSTRQDELAARSLYEAPDGISRLGFAIAHAIHSGVTEIRRLSEEERTMVSEIASVLQQAKRPLIISGYACGSEAVIKSAADIAWALAGRQPDTRLLLTVPECNSMGLAMLGGHRFESALEALRHEPVDAVIILENDLYRRAEESLVEEFLQLSREVIVLDHLHHRTSGKASVLLPAATFAEGDGTLVNYEGRAQRFFQVFVPDGMQQESWRWLQQIGAAAGIAQLEPLLTLDDILAEMARSLPQFSGIEQVSPPAHYRKAGQRIARAPHRYSGRTAMLAHRAVSEPKPPKDADTPLSFTMEGYRGMPPPALIPFFWAPGWNSVQAVNKYQTEVGGPLRGGDPGRIMIQASANAAPSFFAEQPEPFHSREGCLFLVPRYYIFGSDELSVHSPGIAERSSSCMLGLCEADARAMGLANGGPVRLQYGGRQYEFPYEIETSCPAGMALLPKGLPGVAFLELPGWAKILR